MNREDDERTRPPERQLPLLEGGRDDGDEGDDVDALRRARTQAEAEAQRAKAELERAWEEMREAWELREDDEAKLRQLLARLEARNADLELRDRELRGDLARLSDAETALAHSLLLHKLVYKAFHKGFLNDEEDEADDDAPGSAAAARLHPDLVARKQELNEIDSFVQRKRLERLARESNNHHHPAGGPGPDAVSGSGSVTSSTTTSAASSPASSLSLSLSSEDPALAATTATTSASTSSSEATTTAAAAAAGGGSTIARSAVASAAQGAAEHHQQQQPPQPPLNASSGGLGGGEGGGGGGHKVATALHPTSAMKKEGGGSGVKGRVTIAEVVNPMSGALKGGGINRPPPPRSPMKKAPAGDEASKAAKLMPPPLAHHGSAHGHPHGQSGHGSAHGHHHGHGHGHHHHPVKHHPTTLQDLFVAAAAPIAPLSPQPRAKAAAAAEGLQPPAAHGSPRGHSRSRSMGGALSGAPLPDSAAAAAPRGGVPKPPAPPPPPPLILTAPSGEVKKSKIEREIDEYCGEGLNEHEDEDEKVPVATHRLLLKLREENFFVPTANRAFIKTCNTFLVNILKAISSCVKMCKRDLKAQAFWLSYTTSFLHLLKQETKGKLEGMRQIRDPRKNGIQLMSANKLIRKITSMPETSTEYIILSRRIEICGFACKLLQITQRVYSNLLKIITKQLEPLLVPVVFYHSRMAPSPFVSAHAPSPATHHAAPLASPRGAASPLRDVGRSVSSAAVPALSLAPPGSNHRAAAGASLPRSTSTPSFLSGLALPASAHGDYNCTKNGNDILLVLSKMFYNLMSNNVYCTIVQQFFTQTYHVMDAALFNHLIDNARHLATVANALAVKSMLSQLTSWRRRVNLVHRKSKQFAHIREAVNVLSISKAMFLEVDTAQAFSHLNDLQILHLLVYFQPDDLAPEPVPGKVKQKLQERSQQHSKDLSLHIDPTLMFTYKRKKPDTRHHSK